MPFDEGGHAGLIKLNLITGFIIVNLEKSAIPLFIITAGRSKQTADVVRLSKAFIRTHRTDQKTSGINLNG